MVLAGSACFDHNLPKVLRFEEKALISRRTSRRFRISDFPRASHNAAPAKDHTFSVATATTKLDCTKESGRSRHVLRSRGFTESEYRARCTSACVDVRASKAKLDTDKASGVTSWLPLSSGYIRPELEKHDLHMWYSARAGSLGSA